MSQEAAQLDFGFSPTEDGGDRFVVRYTADGERILLPRELVIDLTQLVITGAFAEFIAEQDKKDYLEDTL